MNIMDAQEILQIRHRKLLAERRIAKSVKEEFPENYNAVEERLMRTARALDSIDCWRKSCKYRVLPVYCKDALSLNDIFKEARSG